MESKIIGLGIVKNSDELKKLIAENPDLPIVVFARGGANSGDYTYMCCTHVSASVCEILDCETPYDGEIIETDRDNFDEEMEDWLWDVMVDKYGVSPDENELQKLLADEKARYEPYWKKVIAIYAGN